MDHRLKKKRKETSYSSTETESNLASGKGGTKGRESRTAKGS